MRSYRGALPCFGGCDSVVSVARHALMLFFFAFWQLCVCGLVVRLHCPALSLPKRACQSAQRKPLRCWLAYTAAAMRPVTATNRAYSDARATAYSPALVRSILRGKRFHNSARRRTMPLKFFRVFGL